MIERITEEEFAVARGNRRGGGGREPSELTVAVRLLEPGQGFKLPCSYKHYGNYKSACGGAQRVYKVSSRDGFFLTATCRDGVLYVFRPKVE